ncbi:MAG: type II toxin-antitoxin system VapC family toxin [Chloroflexi bacterium]|nr:type II toxin-antitoxin system VapC family toxin [Chloroflexota bacterium]
MTPLLDTHALLWWLSGGSRLSVAAATAIDTAERVLISPISCWEIGMLARVGRIQLDRPIASWIARVFEDRRSGVAHLSPEAAGWAGALDDDRFPGDPADRLIYATALEHRIPLITKDGRLRDYAAAAGDVHVVW